MPQAFPGSGRRDQVNASVYASQEIAEHYASRSDLYEPERVILDAMASELPNASVLDLGVGGGRTAPHLARLSRRYVGADYSAAQVATCRQRFPELEFQELDARDLGAFAEDEFGFILFSYNGIDYVDHEGRLAILAEIRRVLAPGGAFAFSTHNRDQAGFEKYPWQRRGLRGLLGREGRESLRFLPRHLSMNRMRVFTDEYAIVNDRAHNFSLMTYYIGGEQQRAQLAEAGFQDVVVYDMAGHVVEPGRIDSDSLWLHFLAR